MTKNLFKYAPAFALLTALAAPISTFAEIPPQINNEPVPSLAPMLKNAMPSVVNISVVGTSSQPSASNQPGQGDSDDDSSGGQTQGTLRKFVSLGSGVIVDAKNGYIITNAHVLKNGQTINVTLSDGRQRIAKLIGADEDSDVAIVQIQADNLVALPLADSDKLRVGDFVVAIGNPFGLNQSATSGIVSALQRTNLGIEGYENFIQTDAPINPGNSGGALVNLNGQLVGINTAIFTPDGGNIGIGFAIPSDVAKSVMDQILHYGSVRRGMMGIMIQTLTAPLAQALNVASDKGALVSQVTPDSPAAAAGFQAGDIIEKVNGVDITDASQVTNIVGLLRAGDRVTLEVDRAGKPLEIQVTTATPRQYQEATMASNPLLYDVNLRDFNQVTALHGAVKGVQITGIAPDSPLWKADPVGLRPGDVIVSANMKSVTSTADLLAIAKDSKQLLLNVYRGSGAMFVLVKN